MKRLVFRSVVAMVFLAAAGCKGDPTADLRGGPAVLSLSPNLMFIDQGESREFEVVVRDEQLNPVAATVTVTSTNPAVFTVAADSEVPSPDNAHYTFIVNAVTAGQAQIAVSAGGISDTATITVLPLAFNGAASTATPIVGQPFTLIGTSLLGFSPDANIDFGGGVHGIVTRVVLDTLTVIVPQPDASQPATLIVEGIAVKYVPGLIADLPTSTTFTVTPIGDRETIGAVSITIPGDGAPDLVFHDGFKSGANGTTTFIDYFYQFTLATADTLTFTVEWDGAADVDLLNCNAACTALVGGIGGATAANPETYTVIFAAGTYNLWIESFDDHDEPAHIFKVTVHNP